MVFTWVKLRFLNLSTSDIFGRIIIFVVGCFPVYCKMFSIILGFTHEMPVGPSFPIWQPKMSPKQFRSSLHGKIALVEYRWIKWIEKNEREKRGQLFADADKFIQSICHRENRNTCPYLSYIWMLEQFICLSKRYLLKSSTPSLTMMMNRTMANGNMVISLWKTSKVGIQFRITRNRK